MRAIRAQIAELASSAWTTAGLSHRLCDSAGRLDGAEMQAVGEAPRLILAL